MSKTKWVHHQPLRYQCNRKDSARSFRALRIPLAFLGCLSLIGCSGKSVQPTATGAPLEKALELLSTGKVAEASQIIVDCDGDYLAGSRQEVFQVSEWQFMWIAVWDSDRRKKLNTDIIDSVSEIKRLGQTMLEKATAERDAGNTQQGDALKDAVIKLGDSIIESDLTSALKQSGQTLHWLVNQG